MSTENQEEVYLFYFANFLKKTYWHILEVQCHVLVSGVQQSEPYAYTFTYVIHICIIYIYNKYRKYIYIYIYIFWPFLVFFLKE